MVKSDVNIDPEKYDVLTFESEEKLKEVPESDSKTDLPSLSTLSEA